MRTLSVQRTPKKAVAEVGWPSLMKTFAETREPSGPTRKVSRFQYGVGGLMEYA